MILKLCDDFKNDFMTVWLFYDDKCPLCDEFYYDKYIFAVICYETLDVLWWFYDKHYICLWLI